MKRIIFLALLILLVALGIFLSGCSQPSICSSNDECKDFHCDLSCKHENFCAAGKCDCSCIQEKPECSNASDCSALKCGIPPNSAVCANGECKCKFECNTGQECQNFQCALECKPNYNYCDNGACTCACESAQQEYTPWQVNQLKEDLEGKIVKVKGVVRTVSEKCSNRDCNGECCQECKSGIGLFSSGEKEASIALGGTYKGKKLGCTGSDCNMECWPLGLGNTYSIEGQLKHSKENGYFLEPVAFTLLEKARPSFHSKKRFYKPGERVEFSLSSPESIFHRPWEPPIIQKKLNGKWVEYDSDCGCVVDCNKASASCEKNLIDCSEENCSQFGREKAWEWNQEYCSLKEVDCNWSSRGINEKVFCRETKKAGPGTYRIAFSYAEGCSPTEKKTTAYSNEFGIK